MPILSKAAYRALHDRSPEDAELTYGKGGGYWIGSRRISSRTVNQLLQLCLIRVAYGRIDDYCQFVIAPDGRKMLADPAYVPAIAQAIRATRATAHQFSK